MTEPRCPQTGLPMVRGVRAMSITYKGHSTTIDMPGWYCDQSGESIHTGDDMVISDKALNGLKAKVSNRFLSACGTEFSAFPSAP